MPRRGDRHDAILTGLSRFGFAGAVALAARGRRVGQRTGAGRFRREQFDLEPRAARVGRHRPRAGSEGPERPDDRLSRAVAAGRSAEPRPAAAAGPRRPARPVVAEPIRMQRARNRARPSARPTIGNASHGHRKSGPADRAERIEPSGPRPGTRPSPTAPMRRLRAAIRTAAPVRPPSWAISAACSPAAPGASARLRRIQRRDRHLHQRAAAVAAHRAAARLPDAVG